VISGSSEESRAGGGDPGKLGVKKPRPKASSPNRQGPQQCQVRDRVSMAMASAKLENMTLDDEGAREVLADAPKSTFLLRKFDQR